MSSKVQSTGRKRAAGAGKGRAIFYLTIHPGWLWSTVVLESPPPLLFFSPESAISSSPAHIGPRAKDQGASAPENLPPLEANAEALQFLESLSEPGLCGSGGVEVRRGPKREGPDLAPLSQP